MKKAAVFILLLLSAGIIFQSVERSNLKAFYQWTKEDPLFTSPNFPSASFLKNVEALEEEQKAMLQYLKVKNEIFPVDFLKDIAYVSSLHQDFINHPSAPLANKLIAAYYQTEADYRKSGEMFLNFLKSDNFLKANDTFVSFNTATDQAVITQDFEKILLNDKFLQKEIADRESCFRQGRNCRQPFQSFQDRNLTENKSSFQKDLLPRNILLPFLSEKDSLSGPYLVSTPCFGLNKDLKSPSYPFFVILPHDVVASPDDSRNFQIEYFKLASTNYYKKVQDDDIALLGYDLDRIMVPESNIYFCPDSSFQNTLASIDNLYRTNHNYSLYESLLKLNNLPEKIKAVFEQGKILENNFSKAPYPSEDDAENLIGYYAYTYKTIGDWNKNLAYQNSTWLKEVSDKRDTFLNMYLTYSRKFSNIDFILADAVRHFSAFRLRYALSPRAGLSYIYGIRSMYGLVYLSFSPSVFRQPDPLDYIEKRQVTGPVGFDGIYITYQQAIQKYSSQQIQKWTIDLPKVIEDYIRKNHHNQ